MTQLESALALAKQGFWIFPVLPKGVGYRDRNGNDQISDGKHPAVSGWQDWATRNEEKIRKRWARMPYNIGISTSKFGDDQAIVVVDVDTKKGKRGDCELLRLELEGHVFPGTLEQTTPSGGRHLIYVHDRPLRQGADVLAVGLDIRSKGGYIVAPGSEIDGKFYTRVNGFDHLEPAPGWLVDRLGAAPTRSVPPSGPAPGVDPKRAEERSVEYLKVTAGATLGSRGSTAYKVAARLKDFGCTRPQALLLMDMYWAEKCDPPMPPNDLEDSVNHAYTYGREQQGVAAPEAQFTPIEAPEDEEDEPKDVHPIDKLNEEYAFIKRGAFVLQETTDEKGCYTTEHLSVDAFHAWFANQPLRIGEKAKPVSKWWMESPRRRQYDGTVFAPERALGPRWFNLWRGFATKPATTPDHPAVSMFLEHALKNVCRGKQELFHWLMGYFAHLIQRPWEKPLVTLVFKGKKGTGKNALVERVGALLGDHFLVADDDRYLLSNFNSHLETCLFFVLDEATWAGDKKAEGRLKGITTGATHNIERKGQEPYQVDNLTRVAILGNEEWIVPATHDERRFAVFSIGDGRRQDRAFFQAMREGMEQGGYAHLLRYLKDFDLATVDVNEAPETDALMDQKIASLEPVHMWWYDCLHNAQVGDWTGEWPETMNTNRLRLAFNQWARTRSVKCRQSDKAFFMELRKCSSIVKKKKGGKAAPGDSTYEFHNKGLEILRKEFEQFMGGGLPWED